VPAPTARLQRIAVANDSNAIISTGALNLTAANPAFLYDTVTRTFNTAPLTMLNSSGEDRPPGLVATADGSHIYITQSTSAQPILDYVASSGTLSSSGSVAIVHQPDQSLAADQSGTFVVPYNTSPPRVFNGSFNQVGNLNVNPIAIAVNRQGTRAYVLDNGNMFHNYFLERGRPSDRKFGDEVKDSTIINTPATMGTSIKSGVTPDGATVFMAGVSFVIVISELP